MCHPHQQGRGLRGQTSVTMIPCEHEHVGRCRTVRFSILDVEIACLASAPEEVEFTSKLRACVRRTAGIGHLIGESGTGKLQAPTFPTNFKTGMMSGSYHSQCHRRSCYGLRLRAISRHPPRVCYIVCPVQSSINYGSEVRSNMHP